MVTDPDEDPLLVGRRPMDGTLRGLEKLPDLEMIVTAEQLAHAKYRGATAYALGCANSADKLSPLKEFVYALAQRV